MSKLSNYSLDLLKSVRNLDTRTSIRILARLYDPYILVAFAKLNSLELLFEASILWV